MYSNEPSLREVVDRCRRIETRITRMMIESGFDPGAQTPKWDEDGKIEVPSRSVAVKDILSIIPVDWPSDEEILVMIKGRVLFTLFKEDEIEDSDLPH